MTPSGPSDAPLGVELLDDPGADPVAVSRSLRNIARANRLFGGRRALHTGLRALLTDASVRTRSPLTLLDVGTGAGDLPRCAIRWGQRHGKEIRSIGVERIPAAARLAKDTGLPVTIGCGMALPIRARSVDMVLISQVLHHFADRDAAILLRECTRVARIGVILSDLVRSPAAGRAYALASLMLGFDGHTRRDGETSLLRGYTRSRLASVIASAGAEPRIARVAGVRFVATWTAQ